MAINREVAREVEQLTGKYLDVLESAYAAAREGLEDELMDENEGRLPADPRVRQHEMAKIQERAETIAQNVSLIWFLRRGAS